MNKRPFILNFTEYFEPQESIDKYTEYSEELNLNILNTTNIPAVAALNIKSETLTRANFESTDYYNKFKLHFQDLIIGETITKSTESTDKCNNFFNNFISLLVGETVTLVSGEANDKSIKSSIINLISLLHGETITRNHEESTDLK